MIILKEENATLRTEVELLRNNPRSHRSAQPYFSLHSCELFGRLCLLIVLNFACRDSEFDAVAAEALALREDV